MDCGLPNFLSMGAWCTSDHRVFQQKGHWRPNHGLGKCVCVRESERERARLHTHTCMCVFRYVHFFCLSTCALASMRGWLSFPLHTWRFFLFYYSKCSLKAGYNIAFSQTQITSQCYFQRKTLQNNPQMVSLPLFFLSLCLALSLCLSLHLSVCLYLCFGVPIYSLNAFILSQHIKNVPKVHKIIHVWVCN